MAFTKFILMAAAAASVASQELHSDKMAVDFNGASGSFKLYTLTANSTRSSKFWNINYKALYEVDSSGSKINQRAFPNLNLALTSGTEAGLAHVSGYQHLTSNTIDAHLYMRHALYTQAQAVEMPPGSNHTVNIMANTMKVSYNITGWTFASPSNKLVLEVKMSDNGGDGSTGPAAATDAEKRAAGQTDTTTMVMATGDGSGVHLAISMENYAYVDGANTTTPVAVTQSGNIYKVTMPYFSSSVWYDPTVMAIPTSSSGAVSTGVGLGVTTLLAAVTMTMAGLW